MRHLIPFALLTVIALGITHRLSAQGDVPAPQEVTIPGVVERTLDGQMTTDIQATFYGASGDTTTPRPAVLMLPQLTTITGDGGIRADRADLHSFAQQFQAAGVHVLTMNLDGYVWGGSQSPTMMDGLQDVQAAYDWLIAQPGVDPGRVSVLGSSIGANYAMLLMAQNPAIQTGLLFSPGPDYGGLMSDPSALTGRNVLTYAGTDEVGDPVYRTWLEQISTVTTPAAGHGVSLYGDPALLAQEAEVWLTSVNASSAATGRFVNSPLDQPVERENPFFSVFQFFNGLCVGFLALDAFAAGIIVVGWRRRRAPWE